MRRLQARPEKYQGIGGYPQKCQICLRVFSIFRWRYFCEQCGRVLCSPCSSIRVPLPQLGYNTPQSICKDCIGSCCSSTFECENILAEILDQFDSFPLFYISNALHSAFVVQPRANPRLLLLTHELLSRRIISLLDQLPSLLEISTDSRLSSLYQGICTADDVLDSITILSLLFTISSSRYGIQIPQYRIEPIMQMYRKACQLKSENIQRNRQRARLRSSLSQVVDHSFSLKYTLNIVQEVTEFGEFEDRQDQLIINRELDKARRKVDLLSRIQSSQVI